MYAHESLDFLALTSFSGVGPIGYSATLFQELATQAGTRMHTTTRLLTVSIRLGPGERAGILVHGTRRVGPVRLAVGRWHETGLVHRARCEWPLVYGPCAAEDWRV